VHGVEPTDLSDLTPPTNSALVGGVRLAVWLVPRLILQLIGSMVDAAVRLLCCQVTGKLTAEP